MQVLQNQIIHGDFYKELPKMKMKSIDMILTDLPYNITTMDWDVSIDIKEMWDLFHHVLKDNGVIALTARQPFTSKLVISNYNEFKTELIWLKTRPSNVFNSKKMFMNWHESILVFYKNLPTFNPILIEGKKYRKVHYLQERKKGVYQKTGEKDFHVSESDGMHYPSTVIQVSNDNHNSLHPTQKPVELFEYLIKTYTNEGDLVLDCCAGSGTTSVACMNTNRTYICIEKNEEYFKSMQDRIKHHELPTIEEGKHE